jgi:hypothetical protein
MTGFSADWLRLREPYDSAARSPAVHEAVSVWRRARGLLRAVDLGAGTGANLRYTAPRLGGEQRWVLVDRDTHLLDRVAAETQTWAAPAGAGENEGPDGRHAVGALSVTQQVAGLRVSEGQDRLRVRGPGLECQAAIRVADLLTDLERLPLASSDLVTASALLDLVSQAWLARLVALARQASCAVLAALSYDGRIAWAPSEPADALLQDLVNRHQRTDKGFGPALGPTAVAAAIRLLAGAGYRVETDTSDWRLGPDDAPIQRALLAGWMSAAREVDPLAARGLAAWASRRLDLIAEGRSRLTLGHRDLFARL